MEAERNKIAVIGTREMCTFFRLAGVRETYVCESPEEAEAIIRDLVSRKDIALIVISEEMEEKISEFVGRLTLEVKMPIIIAIPFGKPSERLSAVIDDMIRKALGIKIEVGGG